MRRIRWIALFALVLSVAFGFAACGDDSGESQFIPPPGTDGAVDFDSSNPFANDGSLDPDATALTIVPLDQTLNVTNGQAPPTLTYQAFLGGSLVSPSWSVDRGELGTIGVSTGVFIPTGTLGGKANITASYGGKTATTSVTIVLSWVQNGDPSAGDAGGGAGGSGGVGGEGPGAAVSQQVVSVLNGAPTADPGLAWLYPYDATVWPRGILAPLLQWNVGAQGDYDAVYIHIYEKSFDYKGYFAKTATPFIHHPIVQAAWKALTYSNTGEDVTVDLTFAKGNAAYGPITEKWKIAGGVLKGTVYYNSYGTNLTTNYCCTINNKAFGGATLAVKGGSTDPVLVAGDKNNCRVCHSVAADGSMLITQNGGNYNQSMRVDLKNANAETSFGAGNGQFGWPGIYPDGTMLFSNGAPLAGSSSQASGLFAVPGATPVATTGLSTGLRAGTPAFSPDGKHLAFNFYGGTGGDGKSLVAYDFDVNTKVFANSLKLDTPQAGTDWWPSFMPTNDAVVFERETLYNGRDIAGTRSTCDSSGNCSNVGTHGELWWVDAKTQTATRLDKANGKGYAPTKVGTQHDDDSTLNYEPTVNPVVSGGYAWVVFTSRRLYGNVATINPFWSDPRFHDISKSPTTKKLWVAAIDLNAAPGTDPSHPAFYLPAQELLAGNSRGFWVVDPCHQDGNSCETGDECCGGYCRPAGDGGGLICTTETPVCAQEFEKCTNDGDCCSGGKLLTCINGRCSQPLPN
jgi:hypothetical protein